MSAIDQIRGVLLVRPGLARPHGLASTRRPWAATLARGRDAASLPGLLGNLFSLCGHAHRLCATLALAAARDGLRPDGAAAAQGLRVETQREHIRQVCLAWPQALADEGERAALLAEATVALLACPPAGADRAWLQSLLGVPPQRWLDGWQRDPRAWLQEWSRTDSGWLARLLRGSQAVAGLASVPAPALMVHADTAGLDRLGARLREGPGFAARPTWRGGCAETGPWTRLADARDTVFDTPWLRLGARIAEMLRLAGPGGAGWLGQGSLALGPREGLAWVEMARGLLVHYVRLDVRGSRPVIDACNVLAPTEWNFHPEGAVAQAIAGLDRGASGGARLAALMAAYDPCVRFETESPSWTAEPSHA